MTMPPDIPILPEGWVWTSLEDCVDILDSQRVPINAKERENRITGKSIYELYPYYGATGQVGWIDDYLFDEELFLLGEDGAPFLDQIKNKAYLIRGKSWVNNHAHVLRAIASLTPNLFLCHYLNIFDYNGYVTGTTRLKLNQFPMRKIPIPLPPLLEQHRIVAKIEELFTKQDAGVKSLEKTKAQLKRYRQSVLKHAFEGKLSEEWRERHKDELEPASVLLERIKEERKKNVKGKYKELPPRDTSDLPELPEGWVWAKVGETCVTTSGGTPSRKNKRYYGGTIPWLKSGELENKIITSTEEYITEEGLENSSAKIIPAGTLLMALYGATVGKLGILGIDSAINQAICAIFAPSQLEKKYLFWYLMDYRNELQNSRIGGAQPNISQTIVNKVTLPFPSLPEQHKIVEEIERRFSLTDEVERSADQSLKQAERLRQSILKRAFEGKLVPQDPSDEPASVLIERIKEEKAKREAEQKVKKRKKKMKSVEKKGTKKLYEILKSAKKPLTPNELWKLSKLNSVEFYEELNKEVEGGKIVEKRMRNNQVFLEVKK